MSIRPMKRYRPTKTQDGEYGYDQTMGSAQTVYGEVSWHETEVVLITKQGEDIEREDIIESGDGQKYRVVGQVTPLGGGYVQMQLEKRDKPI